MAAPPRRTLAWVILPLLAAPAACATGPRFAGPGVEVVPAPRYSVAQPELLPDELAIPLDVRGGRPLVDTVVNGRAVGAFLLDTGATGVAIDEELADELRLTVGAPAKIGGVLASESGSVRPLDTLAIGNLQLAVDAAMVLPLAVAGPGEARYGGIVGAAALGTGPFAIDLEQARLTVYNPARFQPPANAKGELLRVDSGLLYVSAKLDGDETVWLLLDTGGMGSLVLWRRFVQAHPDALTVPQKRWALSTGVGGGDVVMASEVRTLRLFGREFQNVPTLIQDAPSWIRNPHAAGIVGTEILRNFRVTARPEWHLVWAEPR